MKNYIVRLETVTTKRNSEEVENIDDLDDVKVLSLVVGNVPKQFIREAKAIDGRNYSSDCFGIWVNYEVETGELVVITDQERSQLYYVDNLGDKHWLDYLLTEQETAMVTEICRKELKEYGVPEKEKAVYPAAGKAR